MAAKPGPISMALKHYSDVELMHLVDDLTDPDSGWADANLIADRIGVRHDQPVRCVVTRLGWMRRYGAVEKDESRSYFYRLTNEGVEIINARMNQTELRTLHTMKSPKMLDLMVAVTSRWSQADDVVRTLMRRQWQHGSQTR